jgi:hypothetical protein
MSEMYADPPDMRHNLGYGTPRNQFFAARPSRIYHSPSGPMVVNSLPPGWEYDAFGNTVFVAGEDNNWTLLPDGTPAKVTYENAEPGLRNFPWINLSDPVITPATEKDYAEGNVPKPLINEAYRAKVQEDIDLLEQEKNPNQQGPFGTTGPGSTDRDTLLPSQGGTPNAENWLGSETERARLEATYPEWDSTQIEDALATFANTKAMRQNAKAYYDPKEQKGTYYQRYALTRAAQQGYGRPQYAAGDEFEVLGLSPQALIQLQMDLKRADIKGADDITLGKIGQLSSEDPTVIAYRNLLAQANLQGMPYKAYLQTQIQLANQIRRAGLDDASPGDPKFDPIKVEKVVTLTGRGAARENLKMMMTEALGRAPKESEVNAYVDRLNAKEKADPSIRTTTYTRDGDSSSVTEETDVDPALIAERQIKRENPKQYQEYQELNYYNAMLQLMGGG